VPASPSAAKAETDANAHASANRVLSSFIVSLIVHVESDVTSNHAACDARGMI
jgi:hypothetical protein